MGSCRRTIPSSLTRLTRLGLLLLGLAVAGLAQADPGYYLLTPYSLPEQLALDLRYWSVKAHGEPAVLWPEAGLRYGVNSRWTTEILVSAIGDSMRNLNVSSLNWQNSFLLTQGQYPFDLAVHAQWIRNRGVGNALELGPVFQTEWGWTQLNVNLIFERDWSSDPGTQLKYQWQMLRRLQPGWRVGVQGFGELGRWDRWSERQSHRAGPVLNLGSSGSIEVRAAYLWGRTYGRRADMFSAQALFPF